MQATTDVELASNNAGSAPTTMSARTRWARRGAWLLAGSLAFVAFGGFLHTRAARPLLFAIFGKSCPFSLATADTIDRARRMGIASDRGPNVAAARPALGFRLDETTRDDVHAWAMHRGVACRDEQPWLIQCANVEPGTLGRRATEGTIEELSLGFRPDGRLSNVTTLRRHLSVSEGARLTESLGATLFEQLDQPRPSSGKVGEGEITEAALSSARVSLRYRDYFADIMGMNLPTTGVAVREQYLSATD